MEGAEPRGTESRSQELLGVGKSGGLHSKLLINSKHTDKKGIMSPIVRLPRSSILDRVQNFLPQMAQANETLSKEMEINPASAFDIEHVDEEEGKIIEMNVALVELSDEDSSEDEAETSSGESSDSDLEGEVTEDNIKLRQNVKKGKIEVLED
ncbi:NOP protein chaperone 1 [Discoglossus pictus]